MHVRARASGHARPDPRVVTRASYATQRAGLLDSYTLVPPGVVRTDDTLLPVPVLPPAAVDCQLRGLVPPAGVADWPLSLRRVAAESLACC